MAQLATTADLARQLGELGITPGCVLLVHTSFSKVAPVEGGPAGLITALEDALGAGGTLVMPSMSDDDEHPFDPRSTPCRALGVVADTFWRLPGVLRSDSPHAFAARGPSAEVITADHPIDFPHGPDSPVGRVHALDGLVLLLGVGHDADTTVHLAEALAGVRYRRPKRATVLRDGRPTVVRYGEIDHCCERFALVDGWLDEGRRQRRGPVGNAEARLARSRDVVEIVTARVRSCETVFLHPPGHDVECDEARQSLAQPEPCPSCGAPLGGRAGCQAAFDDLSARSWTSPARGAMHNMLVDAYAMQHPEEYGRSAKSYIRHLSALGCLIDHPGDVRLYWARPERGTAPIPPKPPLLEERGTLTVADVRCAADEREYQRLVREWSAGVWAAYAPQHALARDYLAAVRRMLDT